MIDYQWFYQAKYNKTSDVGPLSVSNVLLYCKKVLHFWLNPLASRLSAHFIQNYPKTATLLTIISASFASFSPRPDAIWQSALSIWGPISSSDQKKKKNAPKSKKLGREQAGVNHVSDQGEVHDDSDPSPHSHTWLRDPQPDRDLDF